MKLLLCAALAATALFGPGALAQNSNQDVLRQKLMQAHQQHPQVHALNANMWPYWAQAIPRRAPQAQTTACNEVNKTVLMGSYVLTANEAGQPCRIYDLSFPTLQTLFGGKAVTQLPIQSFGAGDYLNLINGNYEAVVNRIQQFKAEATPAPTELSSWVTQIRFRSDRVHALAATPKVAGTGLPVSFYASDLDLGGATMELSTRQQQLILAAVHALKPNASADEVATWEAFVTHPKSVLDGIHFNWNDAEKVYDIFMEGQFLPIKGPIALVDFNASYKLAAENILRSLTHSVLSQLVGFIPTPAGRIIGIAVDDTFEFVDMAYEYQINKFEGTFMAPNMKGLDAALNNRSLNILAAGRASLVQAYIMAMAQGQPFDWTQLEETGRHIRYDALNSRDAEISRNNSSLVLDSGCSMQLNGYFGTCAKDGKSNMYSMISDTTILFWNIGAPEVYDYGFHSKVALKRGAAYILSIGARLFDLPYVGFLLNELTSACKTYAYAGMTDEGFLRSSLSMQKMNGALSADTQELSRWLYLQNLNIFLPKTESQENSIIKANAALLGLSADQVQHLNPVLH